ncbi:MAG: lipopolysaccharide kinase InaA family protein [Candidatus Nanoarchaeia archaeon]|nr:lipopolysaccharide kinase InaA family protein [Candidatus Nanoarchaeia archaeon]MDD5741197.1 lipopolysaccharide kinase InaA family protein [Candidatus Nanoarchaeia archaeon]
MQKQKIIAQGAEAIISLKGNQIIKDRTKKSYRIPVLDENLRKKRTKSEAKILEKVSKLVNVPKVIETKDNKIIMEPIEGKKLSDYLDNLENKNQIAEQIGQEIAKLHDSDIIHGDLTTSNMIYVEEDSKNKTDINNSKTAYATQNKLKNRLSDYQNKISDKNFKIYFIDFGLGFHSKRIEDKAVDLHLIRQALEAKHFLYWKSLFEHIIKGYNSKDKDKILKQLEKVESRGRYKKH